MTRANYLIMIRKLIAAYKKKYDVFGKEKKKNGSKKSRSSVSDSKTFMSTFMANPYD